MPLRIVHLSDLHHPSLDPGMWAAVRQAAIKLEPHLLIVSGDLVDSPDLRRLQMMREDLNGLARESGASLHVVAGNHDVFPTGIGGFAPRSSAFETAFRTQPVPAPAATAANPPPRAGRFARMVEAVRHVFKPLPPKPFAETVPAVRSLLVQPPSLPVPVLLALIDSNPNDGALAFASGEVSKDDLQALGAALGKSLPPHFLRIAVVHHHVLPIAFSNGRLIGNESLMVLRNAADLLALLARHRFDLILHGHKHLSQFVRLDFSPVDAEGYPMAVAAAGAAALTQERNKSDSCGFNFIQLADNGRISVTSFVYGYGRTPMISLDQGSPGIDYRRYEEPFPSVARRAYRRARDMHKSWCESRICVFEVTETGDLLVENQVSGLRHIQPVPDTVKRRHVVWIPYQGRLAVSPTLDEASLGRKVHLGPAKETTRGLEFMVQIPSGSVASKEGGAYCLRHQVANSMTMTDWEDSERRRVKPPQDGRPAGQEWVNVVVSYPTELLEVRLRLPSGFERLQPSLRCERMIDLKQYEVDKECDSVGIAGGASPVPDEELTADVLQGLTWRADQGEWRLRIRRPMVGYRYELYWPLPETAFASETLAYQRAEAWRQALLRMVQQVRAGNAPASAQAGQQVLDELADALSRMLVDRGADSHYAVTLFVYDGASLVLRPVLSRVSWDQSLTVTDFLIPLGDGLAGAAFQQRRTIAWANRPNQSPLIMPMPYDWQGMERENAILAIPLYFDPASRSPWNAIGVVAYSSWDPLSVIPDIHLPSVRARFDDVNAFAQIQFKRLREAVRTGQVPR